MDILIRNTGDMPIYEQIVQQIKHLILKGELAEGTPLPSMRLLAKELRISVITTKRAYEELEKEGLIRSVANKGFYVCEYNTDYLHEKQLMLLEERFAEAIALARQAGLSDLEVRDMVEGLL